MGSKMSSELALIVLDSSNSAVLVSVTPSDGLGVIAAVDS